MKKGMSDKKIPSLLSPEQDKSDLRQRRKLNVSLKNLPGYTKLHHWQLYYCFSGCFRTNLSTYLLPWVHVRSYLDADGLDQMPSRGPF